MIIDPYILLLLGVAATAFWMLYRRSATEKVKVESTIHEETRQKAKPLIPLVVDGAGEQFALQDTPLLIQPQPDLARTSPSWFSAALRDALWSAQRALLLRLENELEMVQQADLSDHFVVAASANQPAALLARTLKHAEQSLKVLCDLCQLKEPLHLWFGRALVLMVPNRKLFDHVVWLTQAGVTVGAGGGYFLAEQRVVFIVLYSTHLSDSRLAIRREMTRAFLYCLGEKLGRYPLWMEEGLARWVGLKIDQSGSALPVAPALSADKLDPQSILDPNHWEQARLEPAKLEQLQAISGRVVTWLATHHAPALAQYLHLAKAASTSDTAWQQAMGTTGAELVQNWWTQEGSKAQAASQAGITVLSDDNKMDKIFRLEGWTNNEELDNM